MSNDTVIATDNAKKKRGGFRGQKSPIIGDNGINTVPGDNSRYASIILDFLSWPDIDLSSIDALNARFIQYLDYCRDNDLRIGNMAAYAALGIDKTNAYDWENGSRGAAHSHFIKKVKKVCSMYREFLTQDGRLNPVTAIFWQKNFDGFRDQSEIVLTPNNVVGELSDPKQITQRYIDALPDDGVDG